MTTPLRSQNFSGNNAKIYIEGGPGAIDTALAHHLEGHRQKEKIITKLNPEIIDELSTNQPPMELEYQHSVGKSD